MPGKMVYVPDKNLIAPEYSGLTKKQRGFAEIYVETGGRNASKCARDAGYSDTSAPQIATANLKNPTILAYIKHLVETKMQAGVSTAWDTLMELCTSAPAATRLSAANQILDRGGLLLIKLEEKNVNINLNANIRRTPAELRKELTDLFAADPDLQKIVEARTSAEDVVDLEETGTQSSIDIQLEVDAVGEIDWENEVCDGD